MAAPTTTSPPTSSSLPRAVPTPTMQSATMTPALITGEVPTRTRSIKSVQMSIPPDGPPFNTAGAGAASKLTAPPTSQQLQPRSLRRRDSLERREAFLKGKEGSRQRRRWENDRLLNNPHATPALPSDYLVPSTHPVRNIPYYLAPLWDAAEFQRAVESKLHNRKNSKTIFRRKRAEGIVYGGMSPMEIAAVNVPREIRGKLKWRRGAWGREVLRGLEEDVRGWVGGWNERELRERKGRRSLQVDDEGEVEDEAKRRTSAVMSDTETETEDEEIVFVGRNGSTTSLPPRPKEKASQATLRPEITSANENGANEKNAGKEKEQEKDRHETISDSKLVYEGLEDDKSASFARWLVHCVGAYYGLRTWSVTREVVVEPESEIGSERKKGKEKERVRELRREAYVGIDRRARGFMGRGERFGREVELPRPLWGMV